MLPVNQTKKQPSYSDPDFRKKLQDARSFKRDSSSLSTKLRLWLSPSVFLKSKWFWNLLLVIVLGLGLTMYLPGPWQANTIEIAGLTDNLSAQVQEEANNYLQNRDPILPKRNLFFIRKDKMLAAIKERVPQLASAEIKFSPGKIAISGAANSERFLLKNQDGKLWVLLDTGVIVKSIDDSQPHAALVLLNSQTDHSPLLGDLFIRGNLLNFANHIFSFSQKIDNLKLSSIDLLTTAEGKSFNLGSSDPKEVPVGVKIIEQEIKAEYEINGHKFFVQFRTDSDPSPVFNNLASLLAQMSDSDKGRLYYIDLRLSQKAFVCYVSTSCAVQPILEEVKQPEESK